MKDDIAPVKVNSEQAVTVEWIFAYGSLIWRPGFESRTSYHACLSGWRRDFSQASPDHRGTPELPGRVVTLRQHANSQCEGIAYQIDTNATSQILEYLDERESGGYSRHVVEVTLNLNTTDSNTKVQALTYIALPENPNTCVPVSVDRLAGLIAERQGPSGSNRDYVLNLAAALIANKISDPVVESLAAQLVDTQQ